MLTKELRQLWVPNYIHVSLCTRKTEIIHVLMIIYDMFTINSSKIPNLVLSKEKKKGSKPCATLDLAE